MFGILVAMSLVQGSTTGAPRCEIPESAKRLLTTRLGSSRPLVFGQTHNRPTRRVEPFDTDWLKQAGKPELVDKARPGQFFTFQIGLLARKLTPEISVQFSNLVGAKGKILAQDARCISLGGIDMQGNPFKKLISVEASHLQPLWCGWDIPKDALGIYRGTVTLKSVKGVVAKIQLEVHVEGGPVVDYGTDDPTTQSRLRWLDSRAGLSGDIPKPYLPVKLQPISRTIQVLGRSVKVGGNGLPAEISTYFSEANTSITKKAKQVLAAPIEFSVHEGAKVSRLKPGLGGIQGTKGLTSWEEGGTIGGFSAVVSGKLDFTGSGQIGIELKATLDMDISDIQMNIPYAPESAKYMMGLNRPGGLRPTDHTWTWDVKRHQDCFWFGDVNAGLMVRLKDENFHRPLLNIYYGFLPLALPNSWGNGGKGGVKVQEMPGQVNVTAYSGSRKVRKGDVLHFIADLYVTPFRTIDTEKQWSTRFVHPHPSRDPKPIDDALGSADAKKGPNVLNVHQATYYNPYINYPYSPDSFPDFAKLVARGHENNIRTRVYYTTREITQNMPELYALHSLNGEVVFPGPGKDAKTLINPKGPNPWLVKNLGSDFVPAWVDHVGGKYAADDISVITTPDSRWNNFYLEGLKWMVDRAKIDGVYIDDTALDASSLRRARQILSVRPNPLIDLHTWNHFNEWAGYANNLNMYMEVLPYLDRLWLGEGFSANDAKWDFWLVEMSGLPFGVMSEMLDGPNPLRGLVFGETGRLGWSGDPRPMWNLFDEHGIQETEMLPFFAPSCPVKTDSPEVLATVYRGKDHLIIAIGNWSKALTSISLKVDYQALGLDPGKVEFVMPEIAGSQNAQTLTSLDTVPITKAGAVVVIRRKG